LNATGTCAACQPGTFAASIGAVACSQCPPSTIASQPGALACSACPTNSGDTGDNTACVCDAGFYDAALGASASVPQCTPCPDGGACMGGALLAQEGWWRESPTDAVFLKCREGYCLPEEPPSGSARRRLAQTDAGHCLEGHGGVLCAICQDDYTMQGGFCKPCRERDAWQSWSHASRGVTIALFVPAGFLLLALLLLLPLLPAWERALWRCTALLATGAEGIAGVVAALKRRCCGGGDDEAELAPPPLSRYSARFSMERHAAIPRRSSASAARWSTLAFGRTSTDQLAGDAAAAAAAPGEG
jgi:hypothetical protein